MHVQTPNLNMSISKISNVYKIPSIHALGEKGDKRIHQESKADKSTVTKSELEVTSILQEKLAL
jgi:hypothetical protein